MTAPKTPKTSKTSKTMVAGKVAVAGLLAVGAAFASAATAAADPPDPSDPSAPSEAPAPPEPPKPILPIPSFVADPDAPTPPAGQPPGSGAPPDFFLSQYAIPALPGTQPILGMDQNALGSMQGLIAPNFKLKDQGQGTLYGVAPTDNNPPLPGKWDYIQRAHGIWHMGMGKLAPDQLGQPLDGTAPPPGTNLPPGIVDYLPDQSPVPPGARPAAPVPPGTPPAPALPPPAPPPPAG